MAGLVHTASPDGHPPSAADRLDSWKEIAAYLKRSVRTVRRWENEQELPVHRHVHQAAGTVYAFKSELDEWWACRRADLIMLAESEAPSLAEAKSGCVPRSSRNFPNWLIFMGIILTALFAYLGMRAFRKPALPTSNRVMLVVLPFENLGPDPGEEYLNDGLMEETITQLGELNPQRLGVIARTSAMRYKQRRQGIDQIGKELHVDYILEGGIRQQGGRARITAQLIRVRDQTHLWAASYDRNNGDLLTVQSEIAQAITQAIEIKLTPEDRARLASISSQSRLPYDDYLKGRYFWNQRTSEALKTAIGYFEHAVQEDPNNSLAYAGLADCYAVLPDYGDAPVGEAEAKAEAAATRALQIDATSGEAYTTLAALSSSRWKWVDAGKKFQRAVDLSPNYATAHQWYAEYLQRVGRLDEAAVELQRAEQLDPLSMVINAMLAQQFYFQRGYGDAIAQFQKVLRMDSSFPGIHLHIGLVYLAMGNSSEAIKEFLNERNTNPRDPMSVALLGYAYAIRGQSEEGRKSIRELDRLGKRRAVPAFDYAVVDIGLGDKDEAFRLLNQSVDEHYWLMAMIKSSPFFDSLRGDPRFSVLVGRVFPPKS